MNVSVIIPTRNRLALLREALASVQMQSYPDWDLIIVDDASEDGTADCLRTLSDPRVRVIRMEQHGERSAARNRGLRDAVAEWVLFLDDDDRLKPHALARLVGALAEHPRAIAAVGARVVFDERGYSQRSAHPRFRHERDAWPDVLFMWVPAQGQALIRKSALLAAGGWNRHRALAEDHELWLRLVGLGPILTIPDTVVEVRVHPGQSSRTGLPGRTADFRSAFVQKLPPDLQEQGKRTYEAFRCNRAGQMAFRMGDYKLSFELYTRIIRRAPFLLCSPLSGPHILGFFFKSLGGSVFGASAVELVRRVKRYTQSTIQRSATCLLSSRLFYHKKQL
jgi:glycosyltransferase involved in cell wall biosynthesis